MDSTAINISDEWIKIGVVLIQLGYEPIAPRPGILLFGRPIQVLPSVIQYADYIRRVDGVLGCYRGLTPQLIGSVVSELGSEKIADYSGLTRSEVTDEDLYNNFKNNLKRGVLITTSNVIISQPFHVISVRMMSQFIGRETLYKSLVGSIVEIYKTEGLAGFFNGLVPKLISALASFVLTTSTVLILNKYIIKDEIGRQCNATCTQCAFSSILYPFKVVSTCMIVTSSRLMAGRPPILPKYTNWIDCWNDLKSRGELKRGSSLF